MKIDELLKRLENFEIKNEKREIAEYLAQTFSDKEIQPAYHVMMKDKTIYNFYDYRDLLESNKVSPDDVFVYVENNYLAGYNPANYFYPFLANRYLLADAYLSKLGLETTYCHIIPATGLKYVAVVGNFSDINRIVVEVADIDNVVTNTNLPTLIHGYIRYKYINDDEIDKIVLQLDSQKLFAGYNFNNARDIIDRYYEDHDKMLANEVKAINYAYNHILQPYRTEYDLKSKQIIASFERKLF